MQWLKHLLEFMLSPAGLTILSLAAGLPLTLLRRRSRLGPRLLCTGAALFLLITFSPLSEVLIANLENDYPPLLEPPPLKTIVVLSADGEDLPGFPITSTLNDATQLRLAEGIRVYRKLSRPKIVVSGGVLRKGDRPVAAMMADYLIQLGIPREDIAIEGRSQTTYENLVEVRKLIPPEPFILVTSACHLRRAMGVVRKVGMSAVPAPAAFWSLPHYPPTETWTQRTLSIMEGFAYPSAARWPYLQWAWHEYLGLAWYRLLGRL
jgi:uncharacterized SAM-binding protein YcdF (DUF218 family)